MRKGFAVVGPAMSLCVAPLAYAQGPTAADVLQSATEIVATVEDAAQCDITLHGAPQLDDLTERWLVAYSGVGPACDDTSARLQREGLAASIAFYRRPNADEIMAEIGMMRAAVRRGFDCLISFHGEPRFNDESSVWVVPYYTSGHQCSEAAEELERKGRSLRVSFQRFARSPAQLTP